MSAIDARRAASLFDAQRFAVARRLRRLTRAELARRLEVSSAAVGQWESGAARPKAQALQQLADELKLPVGFFAASSTDLRPLPVEQSFFRSLRKTNRADRDAATANAALVAEVVEVIERHARLPKVDVPQHPVAGEVALFEIDRIADEVREHFGLDGGPVDDVVHSMERHGIVVVRLPLADRDSIDAFSWMGRTRPICMLGTAKDARDRSRFDAAHELGHIVMHRTQPEPANRLLEQQAHRFASAFLLPTDALRREWPGPRLRWSDLVALKRRWHVSIAALLYRARQEGLMTDTAYESAVKYMSRAGWRKKEPGELGPPEQPRLLRRAFAALDDAGVSLDDLAEESSLPAELLRSYAQVPGTTGRVPVEL